MPLRVSFAIAIAAAASSLVNPASAQGLVNTDKPEVRALVERTGVDRAKLDALMAFAKPAPQAWPCEPPLAQLYQPIGIAGSLPKDQVPPEIQAQLDEAARGMRRALRSSGSTAPVEKLIRIELIPVKAACVDGKLDGLVEYYAAYELRREQSAEHFSPLSQRLETIFTATTEKMEVLMSAEFKAGKSTPRQRALRRGATQLSYVMDTPEVQQRMDQSLAKMGMNTPQAVWSATFNWGEDGTVIMMPVMRAEVSAGLFFPKTKLRDKFEVSVVMPRGDKLEMLGFTDGLLTSEMRMNKTTGTMRSVAYIDNFLAATGQKLANMPNMENYREVTHGGRSMLQMTNCLIDMKPAKLDPCPVD